MPIMISIVAVNTGDTAARLTQFGIVTHVVPVDNQPPNDPFLETVPLQIVSELASGQTVSSEPMAAGALTLSEMQYIQTGSWRLYCFGYIDYMDSSHPPRPRKTSFCRVLWRHGTGRHAVMRGAFIKTPDSEMSEHDYA